MSVLALRHQAIAFMREKALPKLDALPDTLTVTDTAWDTLIREWRKLPPRPSNAPAYTGIFPDMTISEQRKQVKQLAEKMIAYVESLQKTHPNEYIASDQQFDNFIRSVQGLPARPANRKPYEGLFSANFVMPVSTVVETNKVLPNFKGGNAVETRKAIIAECDRQGLPLTTQKAYILATVEHETAGTWQPVREAFWQSESWRRQNLWYFPYYGRGYVQLTHKENHAKYEKILGLPLVENADLVMRPDIALFILVHGCKHGVFTGRAIEDYITATKTDYFNARRVINGTDAAGKIAGMAESWQKRLVEKRI